MSNIFNTNRDKSKTIMSLDRNDDSIPNKSKNSSKKKSDKITNSSSSNSKIKKAFFSKFFAKLSKKYFQTDAFDKDKMILQTLVRKQTLYYQDNNNLFHYVVQNDLNGLKNYLESQRRLGFNADKKLIEDDIDPCGANIILAAYLLKKYDIGRWLVENYPDQAFLPYDNNCDGYFEDYDLDMTPDEMPYTGQNILHISIVHKNLGEIRWLLEFYSEHKFSCESGLEILLNTAVTGTFFAADISDFYCGCYPIHFAAASNCPELFDLVLG